MNFGANSACRLRGENPGEEAQRRHVPSQIRVIRQRSAGHLEGSGRVQRKMHLLLGVGTESRGTLNYRSGATAHFAGAFEHSYVAPQGKGHLEYTVQVPTSQLDVLRVRRVLD